MSRLLLVLVLSLGAVTTPFATKPSVFEPLFGTLKPLGQASRLTVAQVQDLFALATRMGWNVFDLLDEAALDLRARGLRVEIQGDVLRKASLLFNLGGIRVDTFFPLPQVNSLSIGVGQDGRAELEVRLVKSVSAFLELGDFTLETLYGFRDIKDHALEGCFGVTARNGLFTWKLQKILRVPDPTKKGSPNFVAIYLENFFRPKQWLINPIQAAEALGAKP